jgi:hypothetical protein
MHSLIQLQTKDEGNMVAFVQSHLAGIDADIFQIFSTITELPTTLYQSSVDYSDFIEGLCMYRSQSDWLKNAVMNPENTISCWQIEQFLRGENPQNPHEFTTHKFNHELSFYGLLASVVTTYAEIKNQLACKPYHGYTLGDAVADIIHLTQQVAYLMPIDPNQKHPMHTQKAGAKEANKKHEINKQRILEHCDYAAWSKRGGKAKHNHNLVDILRNKYPDIDDISDETINKHIAAHYEKKHIIKLK